MPLTILNTKTIIHTNAKTIINAQTTQLRKVIQLKHDPLLLPAELRRRLHNGFQEVPFRQPGDIVAKQVIAHLSIALLGDNPEVGNESSGLHSLLIILY